ncbi:PfkB family carbohydrate kinase [Actinacidiphila epipremni]|uniref:Carbohydrate kinase family protein n=1 Tax=Actinacidiphila epipremni TaxID=2053013 RepID=A0ABX0ZNC7_9ACTN|nr:PfkB family carbohydrate kinase [Actinacidiphila epipremni]NJP43138.1 carbohydrate kinase family protein [Actinacidiphila epipremni]
MTALAVIGNVSRDTTRYPDGRGGVSLGGAALLTSLAATRAGLRAGPICVLGDDLAHLPEAADFAALDWSAASRLVGPSPSFGLTYDGAGELLAISTDYGVAEGLTDHVLAHLARSAGGTYHVCCRRPLGVRTVLAELARRRADFSLDFYLPSAAPLIREALPWLAEASTVFVNAAEYQALRGLVDVSHLQEVVITDGPRTARVLESGRAVAEARPPTRAARDVTGAGDTLAGTYRAQRDQGATAQQALARAVFAAAEHVIAPPLPIPAPRRA